MKHAIWAVLALAIGLLAYFFFGTDVFKDDPMPPQNNQPATNQSLPPTIDKDADGPAEPGVDTDSGGEDRTVSPQRGVDTSRIDESRLGTVEQQKVLYGQLEEVLKREDVTDEQREKIKLIMQELEKRIGSR